MPAASSEYSGLGSRRARKNCLDKQGRSHHKYLKNNEKHRRILPQEPDSFIVWRGATAPILDRCLAVSFTWEENHRFTDSIRKGLKERGVLPARGESFEVHESLRWTNQQKGNWQHYEPGQVVTFAPARNRPAPSGTVVRIEKKKVVVALASRKEMVLDLRRPDPFDVASARQILGSGTSLRRTRPKRELRITS